MSLPARKIIFGTLTAEEWLKYSVVEINRPSSKGGAEKDRSGTPYDERMGALENGKKCRTCQCNNQDCVGHFGRIVLAEPVYNRQCFKYIYYLLQCICIACSRPRILPEMVEFSGLSRLQRSSRLKEFSEKSSSVETCPWEDCSEPLPYFTYEKGINQIKMYYDKKKQSKGIQFTASQALAVFSRISNEHLRALGFNKEMEHLRPPGVSVIDSKDHIHQFRPESMIFTIFPVVPPVVRPFVVRDGEKCDDDLTEMYNSIIKHNERLKKEAVIGGKGKKVTEKGQKEDSNTLQCLIWAIADNSSEDSKVTSGGRANKCFRSRIQGKGGHVQGNIRGKRVDYSARSVIIGAGVLLEVGEVGVPEFVASRLSRKELVKEWNRAYIQKLIDEGKINRIEKWSGDQSQRQIMRVQGRKIAVELGDVVERHLRDGDKIIFNRQPTLLKESMQSFRVKIIKGYAFRLPLAVTAPFNADFDGDEMNAHVPQGVQANAEVSILMPTSSNYVTGQNNGPIAGIVQDGLVGALLLTMTWSEGNTETLVKKSVFMDCVTQANIALPRYHDLLRRALKWYPEFIRENLEIEEEIPGKLMFSIVFPPNLSYTRRTGVSSEFPEVKIRDGVILPDSGPIEKKIIGAVQGSLVQVIWKECSPNAAEQFLTDIQRLTDYWLPHEGFSVGPSDCQLTDKGKEEVVQALAQIEKEARGMMENYDGDDFEADINTFLEGAGNRGPEIVKNGMQNGERNAFSIMRRSGAKGNIANLAAIVAFVGQQNVSGRRIPLTLSNRTRTLPYFEPGDNSPDARGMIASSYIDGLNPHEVKFHADAGREGVIATAIRTAETGYIQKKISRKLEDLRVYWDGTVRDSNMRIIQFLYGDDGLDPQKLYNCPGVKFPFFVNVENIAARMNSDVERTRENPGKRRKLKKPEIELLCKYIQVGSPGIQSNITEKATDSLRAKLQECLQRVKIYECKIPDFCGEITTLFETSKIQHGDMVGLKAAVSNGQPTTQLTLNVFHYTGRRGADVSLGVPRLKELINTTKHPKSQSCTIHFTCKSLQKMAKIIENKENELIEKKLRLESRTSKRKSLQKDVKVLEKIVIQNRKACQDHLDKKRSLFEETLLGSLISSCEMCWIKGDVDPETDTSPTKIIRYKEYVMPWWGNLYLKLFGETFDPRFWVVTLRLNVEEMCYKAFTIEDIERKIKEECRGHVSCISSPNNIGEIHVSVNFDTIRNFLSQKGFVGKNKKVLNTEGLPVRYKDSNLEFFLCRDRFLPFLKSVQLSGISGIQQAFALEDNKTHEWVIKTNGSNFFAVLAAPKVDSNRTTTNNIREIYQTLGIEAVRKFLIEEITRVLSFGGTYINPRHIQLLVDSMTDAGEVTNVSRYGIGREEGPIKKIMFEQPVDNTIEAAVFTEEDPLRSVASSIMYGRLASSGTGMTEVQASGYKRVKVSKVSRKSRKGR